MTTAAQVGHNSMGKLAAAATPYPITDKGQLISILDVGVANKITATVTAGKLFRAVLLSGAPVFWSYGVPVNDADVQGVFTPEAPVQFIPSHDETSLYFWTDHENQPHVNFYDPVEVSVAAGAVQVLHAAAGANVVLRVHRLHVTGPNATTVSIGYDDGGHTSVAGTMPVSAFGGPNFSIDNPALCPKTPANANIQIEAGAAGGLEGYAVVSQALGVATVRLVELTSK